MKRLLHYENNYIDWTAKTIDTLIHDTGYEAGITLVYKASVDKYRLLEKEPFISWISFVEPTINPIVNTL